MGKNNQSSTRDGGDAEEVTEKRGVAFFSADLSSTTEKLVGTFAPTGELGDLNWP